jgi:hypothetical protein
VEQWDERLALQSILGVDDVSREGWKWESKWGEKRSGDGGDVGAGPFCVRGWLGMACHLYSLAVGARRREDEHVRFAGHLREGQTIHPAESTQAPRLYAAFLEEDPISIGEWCV